MKPIVIIPAYNEQENIVRVVSELRDTYPQYDYIVVNDGSRDNTAALCRENGFPLLDLPLNLGLSGAVQTGLKYAAAHGYDRALQLDADGQHRAEFIAPMLREMDESSADIVIGSRFLQREKPRTLRMLGSNLIAFAMRLTTGVRVCDPTSGMRLYNAKMIAEFSADANYTPEPDTISYLIKNGARVREVQVEMDERTAGESYFNLTRSASYMLRMGVNIVLIQWFRVRGERKDKL